MEMHPLLPYDVVYQELHPLEPQRTPLRRLTDPLDDELPHGDHGQDCFRACPHNHQVELRVLLALPLSLLPLRADLCAAIFATTRSDRDR